MATKPITTRFLARFDEMLDLLHDAAAAIDEATMAAGDDDHPVIKHHAQVANRIRALLARVEGRAPTQ